MSAVPGPLAGIRIADFSWIGAGSFTTKLFADFGADVIKVETSLHMDTLRSTPPFKDGVRGAERSGYFADRNSSKRGIRLNIKHPRGLDIARRLIACSDIAVNNFRPGVMERLGLGYAAACAIRPDIVYLAMSMQGSEGPHAGYVGFGLTIGALSGIHYASGVADRPPAGTNTNYPDHVPNPTHAAFAVLAALNYRRRTGLGQYIDLAQTEPTVALQGPAMIDFAVNGHIAARCGNDHPVWVPHGVFACAGDDRWIAIAVQDDAQWQALATCLALDGQRCAQWSIAEMRRAHRGEIANWLAAVTLERDAFHLMQQLQRAGVPAGVVQDARDLIEHDPQLAHRGHWQYLTHPEMGPTLYNNVPFQLSRTPGRLSRPAPLLGQHTEQVCTELLGLSVQEVAELAALGVFE
ncbi:MULTISPECIES: CaiB/BaiF CoA transferase family protein [Paraburkholderia]|uniref:CoA transferase n=1 Tax=Paraburkholderia metrosideri TaxID=580937 RepID=A0ABW9E6A6_9BURK